MSSPPVALRPVSLHDAESLARIRVEAMRESLEAVGRFDPQRARDRFLNGFEPDHTREIVAAGERVGFVVVRPIDGGLLLDHLYLLPAAQGRGIGSAVLAAVFRDADRAGQALRVSALRQSRSNDLYLRHGFRLVESSEWDNHYMRPSDDESGPCFAMTDGTAGTLQTLRDEIDRIDEALIELLARRFSVTREVGRLKAREAMPAVDAEREAAQQRRHRQLAAASGLAPELVRDLFRLIIDDVVREHRAA